VKLKTRLFIAGFAVAGGLYLSGRSVEAHHSGAMFDDAKTLELAGTIKEFQWKNPHVWIQVNVKDADGTTKEWSIEGGGPNSLSRNGWRPSTFKPGDAVTIRVHPMRDGSAAGNFMAAKWSDGRTLGRWE
jgi:hypothetical protein